MATTNLMNEITIAYPNMTRAEKKVADIVLSRPQDLLHATINDLAKICNVGETSVFRFCRTLSLNGYQDFKLSLALSTSLPDCTQSKDTINLLNSSGCEDTSRRILQIYKNALDCALGSFHFDAISRTVDRSFPPEVPTFLVSAVPERLQMKPKTNFSKYCPILYITATATSSLLRQHCWEERISPLSSVTPESQRTVSRSPGSVIPTTLM